MYYNLGKGKQHGLKNPVFPCVVFQFRKNGYFIVMNKSRTKILAVA